MTKLNVRVPYNVEMAAHGREALQNIEANGGHFEEANEVSLAQVLASVGAKYDGLPEDMLTMHIRVPYNVEMAGHGSSSLSDLEANGGHW